MADATRTPTDLTQGGRTDAGIGAATLRPDGTLKVTGEFAYSSDMWHEDMLWGFTLRSTVAHAEIVSIDTSEALAQSGVYAVLTYDEGPMLGASVLLYRATGRPRYLRRAQAMAREAMRFFSRGRLRNDPPAWTGTTGV